MLELNKIYNMDCLDGLKLIDDNSIDCIITSPPYNKGYWSSNRNLNNGFKTKSRRIDYQNYNDCMKPEDYELWQIKIIEECLRVLKPTGSLFYNHIDILNNHQTIHPKYIYQFPLKQIIIWNRKNTPKLDKSYFFPINEYIFWIQKDKKSRVKFNRKLSKFNSNIWNLSPDTKNKFPAPFPEDLSNNCIVTCSNENDIILDIFAGSGTTLKSAKNLNRQYLGFEISKDYCDIIEKRLRELSNETNKTTERKEKCL